MAGNEQGTAGGDQIVFESPGLEPEELLERSAAAARYFVQIPESVLFDERLSASELKVYAMLRRYARRGGECWPGQATLAANLGMSDRGLRKCLVGLRDAGYLEWRRRFATSNVYVIRHVPRPVETPQSGTTVPLSSEPQFPSVRNHSSSQSGTTVPTEQESEETETVETEAGEVPPSAGELAGANSRPAPADQSPEGGSAPLTPVADGRGAASPEQASFLESPPSVPPKRRRRAAAAGEGPGNWVAEFSAVHREKCGGEFGNFALAGRLLKPLREQHGHDLLLAAWRLYVAGTEVKWIRVTDFAAKPKPWLDKAGATASAPKLRQEPPKTRAEAIAQLTGGRRVA